MKPFSVLVVCFLNNFCVALVSVHNCLPAIVYILDRILPSSRPPTDSLHAIASFLVLTTGICLSSFPAQFASVSLVPSLLFLFNFIAAFETDGFLTGSRIDFKKREI
jgi:hypothetical protein